MVVCGGIIMRGENWGTRVGGGAPATLFTTNLTWTDMESNRCLHSGNNRQDRLTENCEEYICSNLQQLPKSLSKLCTQCIQWMCNRWHYIHLYVTLHNPVQQFEVRGKTGTLKQYTGRTGWQLKMCKYGIMTYRKERAYCGMLPHSELLLATVSSIPTIR